MKSPLGHLLLVTVFVGIGLWVGVKWFLGETDDFPDSIDIRSLGYLRDDAPASDTSESPAADLESVNQEPLSPTAFSTPEPKSAVEEISEKVQLEKPPAIDRAQDAVQVPDDDGGGLETEEQTPDTAALGTKEVEAREQARKRRLEELGLIPKPRHEPTTAIDVSLIMPEHCAGAVVAAVPVGLKFRHESSVIKGESLNALESIVALYRDCQQGEFVLVANPLGREDATRMLTQMRFDEVKYFFIQHSVSIDAVQFPEEK